MEKSKKDEVRNIALIGSTGSGKSTTGNMILGGETEKPFIVGNDAISCTFFADQHLNKTKGLRIVDTPGFGDNRFHEKEVDKIIKDLTLMVSDPTVPSTGGIDAFLLPIKFNPRPQTLKTDLEHFMDLFGTVALKTLIIMPIFLDDKPRSQEAIRDIFSKMPEILRILKEGKGCEPNDDWFCPWDNLKPRQGQEQELLAKINKLELYTHKKFLEAAEEIKKRLNAKVEAEVKIALDRAKKDFADDKAKMEAKIKEVQERAEKERKELLAAQERAQRETKDFAAIIAQINESNKAQFAQVYEQMKQDRDLLREQMEKMQQNNSSSSALEALLAAQQKQNEALVAQVKVLANKQPPAPESSCFISTTCILLADNRSIEIQNLRPGDQVVTKDGGKATQSEELVKWQFPEGTMIYGFNDEDPFFSAGHMFWTTDGWKAIEPGIAKLENSDRGQIGKLGVGDILFKMKEDHLTYDLVQIHKLNQGRLAPNGYLYGVHHLDGHRSYHANGFLVAMNYPIWTLTRFKQGLEKLSVQERKKLLNSLHEVAPLLDIVLGPFISQAISNV